VPQEIKDFADMAGCTKAQKLWRVLLPSAKPSLMIGINQVIMLALNMVIISSMIGAGGLGYDVLLALRALKIGQAMEAGLAIVIMAVVLDRLSQAMAHKRPEAVIAVGFWGPRRHHFAIGVLVSSTLQHYFPGANKLPDSLTFTTAPIGKRASTGSPSIYSTPLPCGFFFCLGFRVRCGRKLSLRGLAFYWS
jgi:glycine betaine/proline transport system permease protein